MCEYQKCQTGITCSTTSSADAWQMVLPSMGPGHHLWNDSYRTWKLSKQSCTWQWQPWLQTSPMHDDTTPVAAELYDNTPWLQNTNKAWLHHNISAWLHNTTRAGLQNSTGEAIVSTFQFFFNVNNCIRSHNSQVLVVSLLTQSTKTTMPLSLLCLIC